jgi:ABC-type cobalt transport system substrate-binding protein
MIKMLRRHLPILILTILFILVLVLSLLSDGYYGGADNITHYFISRYAFKYPELFLNAWGRPLYTILSAPFAQFGLHGLKLLNILLGISTAWFIYRIAKMLEIKTAVISIIFVCFTPLYFVMLPTALTEILFSFVLVLTVFLFIRGNYTASAIVISFIPFARTEGFILLPVFFFALWRVKQYKPIPFLATGVVVFSLLGCWHFKDLFWVFTQFPYPVTYHHPVYNKPGSLWHFLEIRDYILGLPLEILFLAGTIGILRELFSSDKSSRHHARLLLFLVLFPFLLYLVFHAVLYWQAMGGSMGLERVLAAVLPLAALVGVKGFQLLYGIASTNRYIRWIFTGLVVGVVPITPFRTYIFPFPLSPEETTIKKAAAWLKASQLNDKLLFYTDNNVPFYMGLDPYQKSPMLCSSIATCKALDTIPPGSVLVWDAHFGANESKISVDSLLENPRLQLVNYFRPAEPWITFGGYNYACYIMQARQPGEPADNYAIRDSLQDRPEAEKIYETILNKTFELPGDAWDPSYFTTDIVHRGRQAFIMDGRTEYSQGVSQKVSTLPLKGPKPELRTSMYVYLPALVTGVKTRLIISFEHKDKSYSYSELDLNSLKIRLNRWNRVSLTTPLPIFTSPDDLVKVYIWNPGKQLFYIDDLKVEMTADTGK